MKWIKEHKIVSFLLAVIIISFGVLIISVIGGGSGNFISDITNNVLTKVEAPLSKAGITVSDNISGIFSYKKLQEENAKLKEENEQLKEQVTNLTLTANELAELKALSKALNYEGISGDGDIVSADVISMDGTNWMNIFTINRGTESDVNKGDTVICGEGLVGRISDSGKGWAKVVSIIDESSKISFKISGNLKLIGVVEGSSDASLSGFMLESNAKVAEGDRIVTSGMGLYPAGIEIGKVTKVKYDSNEQLQKINVKPFVEFKSLQKVSVII